ncbi:MAG: indole-3-glycerol phosphate synthase TrpC [Hyphomicrobiaceae bacterium]|nr:indole-3-glycerol phosphate synthase TrpC [Hyphomicrobiaceae bacterium]
MNDILKKITSYKRAEVAAAKAQLSLAKLEEHARTQTPVRSFANAITRKLSSGKFALIAEIKKASPSKGVIRQDFNPATLAQAYEVGGACCLSVLTDRPSFQGSPEFLSVARETTNLPILRKDFIIETYQVTQARAWGADCILIIMAQVDNVLASELITVAREWEMDTILEVHDEKELDRALNLESCIIGINNRDLRTFRTNLSTTDILAPLVTKGRIVVSESGIKNNSDLQRLARKGVRTFLVGESLMRQSDVMSATQLLLTK